MVTLANHFMSPNLQFSKLSFKTFATLGLYSLALDTNGNHKYISISILWIYIRYIENINEYFDIKYYKN